AGTLQVIHVHLGGLVRARPHEQTDQRQPKPPTRLVMGKGQGMLRAFGIELALEELVDLVERERRPFIAGGHGIAPGWFAALGRIDRDEPVLDREVEHIAQRREVLLLGDRGEQWLFLGGRPFYGLIERTRAVKLGSVSRNARQGTSYAQAGVVIDG